MASGLGSRLGGTGQSPPKCLRPLTGTSTILDWQVDALLEAGLTITIIPRPGNGHIADWYKDRRRGDARIQIANIPLEPYAMSLSRAALGEEGVLAIDCDIVLPQAELITAAQEFKASGAASSFIGITRAPETISDRTIWVEPARKASRIWRGQASSGSAHTASVYGFSSVGLQKLKMYAASGKAGFGDFLVSIGDSVAFYQFSFGVNVNTNGDLAAAQRRACRGTVRDEVLTRWN